MGKIYCIMGKSASGKDTVYKELRKKLPMLKGYVMYTTRPARDGERDGEDYFFVTEAVVEEFEKEGRLVEKRIYHTVLGPWIYATIDDGQFELERCSYLMLTTPEAYIKLKGYFGKDRLFDIYVEVEDGLRLARAVERERKQHEPHYKELCRRFLADSEDFSEEKLEAAEVIHRYDNTDLSDCVERIMGDILKESNDVYI